MLSKRNPTRRLLEKVRVAQVADVAPDIPLGVLRKLEKDGWLYIYYVFNAMPPTVQVVNLNYAGQQALGLQ